MKINLNTINSGTALQYNFEVFSIFCYFKLPLHFILKANIELLTVLNSFHDVSSTSLKLMILSAIRLHTKQKKLLP